MNAEFRHVHVRIMAWKVRIALSGKKARVCSITITLNVKPGRHGRRQKLDGTEKFQQENGEAWGHWSGSWSQNFYFESHSLLLTPNNIPPFTSIVSDIFWFSKDHQIIYSFQFPILDPFKCSTYFGRKVKWDNQHDEVSWISGAGNLWTSEVFA